MSKNSDTRRRPGELESPARDAPDDEVPVRSGPSDEARGRAVVREDIVDRQSMASFPASDPPGWWAGR